MPTFLELPVELQLQIISEVDLNDIEQLTLCCKAIHRRSEERLAEQYARKRSFHTIAIGHIDNQTWDEDKQIRGVHPLLVLRDIVADPQARFYTKTLIIGTSEISDALPFLGDQEEAELDESDIRDAATQLQINSQLFMKALEMSEYDYAEYNPETRIEEILSGNMVAATRLLIPTFPNLQKLRLMDKCQHWAEFTHLKMTVEAILSRASFEPDRTKTKTLSKLTEVGMIGTQLNYGSNYEVLRGFMSLPSLKSIRGRLVDGDSNAEPWTISLNSKLTNIEFRQSSIDAATFKRTLCVATALRSFIYDFRPCSNLGTERWEPRQIVEALKAHTKKTLSNLELTFLTLPHPEMRFVMLSCIDFRQGEPFIGSLSTFEVLETLRLETMMLYKEIEGAVCDTQEKDPMLRQMGADVLVEPERLVDILPTSARRLRLVGGLSREDATTMLEDLPALKDQRLPNLSRIFFEDIERSDVDETLIKECENAGVKMKFWRPQPKGRLGLSKER